jgi:hypothetical protein
LKQSNITALTITGVVAILFLLWYFDPKGRFDSPATIISSDTTVVYMPPVNVSLPPSSNPTVIYQPIPANIDSLAVIRDYYLIRQYQDSLENDTVKIVIKESVGQNKINSRDISYRFKLPVTTTITQFVENKTRKLLVGGLVGMDSLKTSLYLGAAYQNKSDQLFIAGYNPFNKSGVVGAMLPISLRRKK